MKLCTVFSSWATLCSSCIFSCSLDIRLAIRARTVDASLEGRGERTLEGTDDDNEGVDDGDGDDDETSVGLSDKRMASGI